METERLLGGASSPPDYGSHDKKRDDPAAVTDEDGDTVGYIDPEGKFGPLSACQIATLVLASLMAVLGVAMLAGGYQGILSSALRQQLVIKEGSKAYNLWKSTPVPLSLRLHVFNLTNPEEFQNGEKPIVEEVGPYVWREYHEKQNVTFHPNETVTYLQQRWWVWDQEASGNLSQDDVLITLNSIPVAAAYSMKDSYLLLLLDHAFTSVNESLTISATARELVFDGVEDPLLDWVQKNIVAEDGKYHFLLPLLQGGAMTEFDKFAWFYKRNLSLTYDGLFNMMTGEDTLEKLGKIDMWNGRNSTSFYTPPCNEVTGSAGELFPPHLGREDLIFFSSDLCMSAKLFYKEKVDDYGGVGAYRFWGTNHTFANGTTVPGNECYCVKGTCAPMGLLNAESCRMGAPAFVSFPHFYAADPFLLDLVDGLEPNEEKHSFYMDIVPEVGVPATVSVKLQINLHVTPVPTISLLRHLPEVYMPMLWFEVKAGMTPDLVSQMKMLLFFLDSSWPSVVIWSVLIALAVVIVVVVLVVSWRRTGSYQPVS